YRTPVPVVRRRSARAMAAGRWHDVSLSLANEAARPLAVHVHDHPPGEFETRDQPVRVTLPARGWARVTYSVRPIRRGEFRFEPAALRMRSRLGLLERQVRGGTAESLRVYPDFGALSGYALLATDHRLSQMGILQRRRRGE